MTGQGLPHKLINSLPKREAAYFLRELRQARYAALEDAENFTAICFVLEELGARLYVPQTHKAPPRPRGLGDCIEPLRVQATHNRSRLLSDLKRLKTARNDKSHRGVYARNTVTKAVAVSVVLEEVLMQQVTTAADVMVEGVVYAEPFMTLAKVRELMLAHSFSHLPYDLRGANGQKTYDLISDYEVAERWHSLSKNEKYSMTLSQLVTADKLTVIPGTFMLDSSALTPPISTTPQLVQDAHGNVIGIVSAFDWL